MAGDRFLICLPTYNERENLERMADALVPVLGSVGDVLVIDDASPDGTGAIADRLAAEHPNVRVLHRPGKQGLGRAYLDGFRYALAHDYARIVQMDCDFSHDPAAVPALLAAVDRGADLALGSRYVRGGRVSDWGLGRRLISRAGCLYARVILTAPVHDLTGGFKCFRREVLEALDLDAVAAQGYSFQIETTYRALAQGFRVVEVPITFCERERGSSKMSSAIVLEAVRSVPSLRLARVRGRIKGKGTRAGTV